MSGEDGIATATETAQSPRASWRRPLLTASVCVALVVGFGITGLAVVVGSLSATYDSLRKTLPNDQVFPTEVPSVSASVGPASGGAAQNILLLGTDTRGPAPTSLAAIRAQRSDTMLLVHVPADGKHVYVMSIMRDSWVTVPGHGKAKINAALSYGGVPLTVEVVQDLFGVKIDHVAIVSFSGFEGLTRALGDVTVDNSRSFSNLGYDFPQGRVTLTGPSALAFVRARYPFADGDYQRVRNQQAYVAGVTAKTLTAGTLLDPFKLHDVVASISPYVLTDRGLDSGYLAKLAVRLRTVQRSDIEYFTVPTDGTGMEGEQSVVYLDDDGIAEISQDLKNDTLGEYQPCQLTVCP